MAGILKGNLDVTKIPKDKIYNGKKGKYIPVVVAINNEVDQFGNNGSVTVDQSKEEREAKVKEEGPGLRWWCWAARQCVGGIYSSR